MELEDRPTLHVERAWDATAWNRTRAIQELRDEITALADKMGADIDHASARFQIQAFTVPDRITTFGVAPGFGYWKAQLTAAILVRSTTDGS